jgi:hypothetical protein
MRNGYGVSLVRDIQAWNFKLCGGYGRSVCRDGARNRVWYVRSTQCDIRCSETDYSMIGAAVVEIPNIVRLLLDCVLYSDLCLCQKSVLKDVMAIVCVTASSNVHTFENKYIVSLCS